MNHLLENCTLCPRKCGVNRLLGQKGFCGATHKVKVARAALHFWEEPCISGKKGSGTVFFSGCNLKCVYCQNYQISTEQSGIEISVQRLVEIFLKLQSQGALNINLVTPTHYVPQIIQALLLARKKGLSIPIIYNSSGYESVETIKILEGFIDVYLPDIKYFDDRFAKKYSFAKEYFTFAKEAVQEMFHQVGRPVFDKQGIIKRGVIIRHLMLPEHLEDSKQIVKTIYDLFGDQVFVSIMNQYTPLQKVADFPEINRKVTDDEYEKLIDFAISIGIENGFIQEGETAKEGFIPKFDFKGVL
ncbi:MAG: hypothetical protein K0R90_830 [Oscillospiraceae bacterium]|jgi:putative pyruvate formate lyase activating enzyme|nr:hypothetical protein [Oscillospiraceae bacterium]